MCGPKVITHDDFNAGFFEASIKAYGNTGNYVASPLSVLVLMSALLTAKGPQGNTAKEICEAIVGKKKQDTCTNDPHYKEVVRLLEKIRTGVETARSPEGKGVLRLSDAVFIEKSLSVRDQFVRKFTFFQGDKVMRTLFNTSDAYENINEWANTATDGLIPKYLKSQDELGQDTLLVLLNAIAFMDKWAKPFDTEKTQNRDFRLSKKETIQVPMMSTKGEMIYFEEDDFKVLAKSFANERFSFVIFLPQKEFDLDDIEDEIKEGDFKWNKVKNLINLQEVELVLPKFKIEHELDLKPALELLGIRSLFDRSAADLTGITSDAPLYASGAKQVAMMQVDEAGVEAAAVSGVELSFRSSFSSPSPFIVDQPFYCSIYDSQLEMPLFIARIVDPR
ncbi:hypothetical protein ACTXT7_017127 [Hymenolepis weldensis]